MSTGPASATSIVSPASHTASGASTPGVSSYGRRNAGGRSRHRGDAAADQRGTSKLAP